MNAKHTYHFTCLESHLDTFGHINNATYLTLFEQARWDWITKGGYGLDMIHKLKVGPTILEINIKFKREIRLRENIRIDTFVESFDGKTGKVFQKMINENDKVCTEIELLIGVFDMKARKLVQAPPEWVKALGL